MSNVFKALSDPTRRRVLELLRERSMSAGELAEHFTVSKPAMSSHFRALRAVGLVVTERRGKSIIYHLQMSILEESLMGFAATFGLMLQPEEPTGSDDSADPADPTLAKENA
jgi:DNA-binding transcriptional ArsR family regulator